MARELTIALAGNPNCGKTALFNALTGSSQRVGNWPGVTVDRKTGHFESADTRVVVVDLPGTYSISVSGDIAIDEKIACEFLLANQADVVVNVLDGSNLVRNLYLTLQLLELGLPVILAVNMMDVVEKRGVQLYLKRLQKLTGCPVVALVANQKKGVEQLKTTILAMQKQKKPAPDQLLLPEALQQSVDFLSREIRSRLKLDAARSTWMALRLLEGDAYVVTEVNADLRQLAEYQVKHVEAALGEETDILIADARYTKANHIADKVCTINKTPRQSFTEWADRVVLNRLLGIPLFLLVMYTMFVFAINVGGAFQDFFDISSSTLFIGGLTHVLSTWHFPVWSIAILADGLGKGVNTIVTFAPIIGAMFLFLAFLEDSGYMARAAFVMDRLMRALGLPGKSFVPMIVGFGCNVPAVMGARTLANPRDRILAILMMPFMSCGARLAIFSVFASAFFPHGGANVIFLLYLLGIVVAVLSGLMLRKTLLPGKPAPLIMELPSYHMPRLRSLSRHAWLRLKGFLFRAGKYILPICVLIGVLNSVSIQGRLVENDHQHSLLAEVGRWVTPVFAPMGLTQENWPATVGLATGVLAKEVVVGTLNTLYTHAAPHKQHHAHFDLLGGLQLAVMSIPNNLSHLGAALVNPLQANAAPHDMSQSAYGVMFQRFDGRIGAFAYLLFVLLYFPCVSTMAVMRREINRRWAYFSVAWSTGLAYALAVICFQMLTILLHPLSSLLWSGAMVLMLVLSVWLMRWYSKHGGGILERSGAISDSMEVG